MNIPLIEKIKIQARVLVPLIRALQTELGEARANAIVSKALGVLFRKYGEQYWREQAGGSFEQNISASFETFADGGAMDYEVIQQGPDTFELNVTGCRYAQFYQKIGAPDLGFLLVCASDFAMAEGYGPDVQFTRTQTIMQGASHCDFRYALKKKPPRG